MIVTEFQPSGESFTRIQRDELRGKDAREAALLIGQFGIGLLSAFSVSRRVEVATRSYQSGAACRWACDGDIHYTVDSCDKPDAVTGKTVSPKDPDIMSD